MSRNMKQHFLIQYVIYIYIIFIYMLLSIALSTMSSPLKKRKEKKLFISTKVSNILLNIFLLPFIQQICVYLTTKAYQGLFLFKKKQSDYSSHIIYHPFPIVNGVLFASGPFFLLSFYCDISLFDCFKTYFHNVHLALIQTSLD